MAYHPLINVARSLEQAAFHSHYGTGYAYKPLIYKVLAQAPRTLSQAVSGEDRLWLNDLARRKEIKEGDAQETTSRLLTMAGRIFGFLIREQHLSRKTSPFAEQLKGRHPLHRDGILQAALRLSPSFLKGLGKGLGREIRPPEEIPLIPCRELSESFGRPILLMPEGNHPGGAVNYRGTLHFLILALLAGIDPDEVVLVTTSLGGHALCLGEAARDLGFTGGLKVYSPNTISDEKREAIENGLGIKIKTCRGKFRKTERVARAWASKSPSRFLYVPPFDHPEIAAGNATFALDIGKQIMNAGPYAVVAPMGGAVVAGLSVFFRGSGTPVFGVESRNHQFLVERLEEVRANGWGLQDQRRKFAGPTADLAHPMSSFHSMTGENGPSVIVTTPEENAAAVSFSSQTLGMKVSPHAASGVATAIFRQSELTEKGLEEDSPLVVVVTSRMDKDTQAHPSGSEADRPWQSGVLPKVYEALAQNGFLNKVCVREIQTAEEGIELVELLVSLVPPGWDLIDLLREIDFGPWTEEKGINATLRSMGLHEERRWINKGGSIFHAFRNRGTKVIGWRQQVKWAEQKITKKSPEVFLERFKKIYPRLVVELHVAEIVLERRPDWWERLWPQMTHEQRLEEIANNKILIKEVREAMADLKH